MKVYIAAKYGRRYELRHLATALKTHGVEVTSRWLDNGEVEAGGPRAAAEMDLLDVERADTVLFIGEPTGSANVGGGRWFELGYAYAQGKRCIAVLPPVAGERDDGSDHPLHESVFTCLADIETVATQDEAILRVLSRRP